MRRAPRQGRLTRGTLAPIRHLYRTAGLFVVFWLALSLVIGVVRAADATCGSLAGLALPDTKITAAESIPAGTYTAPDGEVFPNLPAFCRVAATLTPTSDSDIKIEVWMPNSGWNGRFLGTGNFGVAGVIQYGALGFLPFNFAVANTDMGTSPAGTDPLGGRVLTGHPEKIVDYVTRSTNLMTVRSKQVIEAFYGRRQKYSYLFGCSTGGSQGIHEALQFPGDYDGIMAYAPGMNGTHHAADNIWDDQAFNRHPVNLSAAQATAITAAIVKECGRRDGGLSSDNFLTDPRDCHWDPAALQCTGGVTHAATCLTAPQVRAMRKFYEGPINPRTGERIYAGRTRGSESNSGYPAEIPLIPTNTSWSPYWTFGNDYNWLTFDFDHDMDTIDDKFAFIANANTADLEEFKSHGGKLLLFHGFADPVLPTLNTIAYYERLITSQTREGGHGKSERKEALHRTQEFARLFLLPGVGHCGGGAGPDTFDGLSPLVQWVEQGIAPDEIVASKIANGVTTFARPLCPYPALPRYSGAGDPTKASSFRCVEDRDRDDNQPPAPEYLNDGHNFPIVPIDDRDHGSPP